ncbi:hypothetical protein DVH07_06545 [Hafnia paralvei]|uniref:phage tail termination protein n=1 Tax=Hafnia paralvei TaxID=546367 RepID=UPI000DF1A38A|nr:hypothetical protein [Hafnia paralvei]RDA68354.1 hypothetical protein DU449_07855 [Hafnia paralvei]RDA69393.1 hypothetical protein DVH09_08450 [Hafnia paralvei]RDA69554.1 hypothetical protein DVH08_09445 [Hafnia paralvei]RDA79597.1 hypothetical protein DVH10_06835 [Hafnia paralvei]RDA80134.1 hypothetical protein DVH07_06545 [Hafnia paralvei]
MIPSMHDRVKQLFVDAGLTAGYVVQTLVWTGSEKLTDSFIVFRPNGGSAIRNDLGSNYYILVDLIGAKGKNSATDQTAQNIISYVQANPMPNDCIGHIENMGGIPSPVLTEEGRLVYRLQFAVIYGE